MKPYLASLTLMLSIGLCAAQTHFMPSTLNPRLPELLRTMGINGNTNVLVNDGKKWSRTNIVTANNLLLERNRQFILQQKNERTGIKILSSEKMLAPNLLVITSASGSTNAYSEGSLFLKMEESPLPWDSTRKVFASTILLGIDIKGGGAPTTINPEITVALTTSNASLETSEVSLSEYGTVGYKKVPFTCKYQTADATVSAHSIFGDSAYVVPTDPNFGAIQITASESRIFGYGLGTTKLVIQRLSQDTTSGTAPALDIMLKTTQGELEPNETVHIETNQQQVVVTLRSVGLGTNITVTADSGMHEVQTNMQFIFPSTFLVATCLGGCLGGTARWFRAGKKKNKRPLLTDVLVGCVVGILIVAAVVAGVIYSLLPSAILGTELGAFVIAGVAGYGGIPVLDLLKTGVGLSNKK